MSSIEGAADVRLLWRFQREAGRMDFAYFESLSASQAQELLEQYRDAGLAGVRLLEAWLGTTLDYSIESVPVAFTSFAGRVDPIPRALDESLPAWIRESESYLTGLYDLDPDSRSRMVLLSHYFGETVRLALPAVLGWGIGREATAVQGQPVLDGFRNGVQLAPLLITENLIRRLHESAEPATSDVDRAVQTWLSLAQPEQ